MTSFEELFIESKGKPISYKGKILVMMDLFPIKNGEKIKIVIESVGSDWRQGLSLRTKGSFIINKQKINKAVVFWKDTAPKEFELEILTKNEIIEVKNVWDIGDGVIHSWHNGAAMIVEENKFGRKYMCNDGHPDENFEDIIFRIERIKT
jgi:hypothetical protein